MEPKAYSYIRFSTPEQLKGDSLRRQLEASRQYAIANHLDLDESMQDLGLSAYHGIHRIKGALGRFLQLVEAGKIEKGSFLIVENLDRLSREDVLEALNQFISIIQAGITLVTLQDNMKYSKESVLDNWGQLITSIAFMARAHEESKTKSIRGAKTWVNKRMKATNGESKLTSRCPAWLKPSADKKSFVVIKEAEQVINLIYDMKLEGKGSETIAKLLNQSAQLWKPKGRKDKLPSWRKSYINKILYNNRALIGEFQPYKTVNGKRVKEGEPILDYYPSIIPLEKYNRVQALIQQNRSTTGLGNGRNDKVSNLFGHMAVCHLCGYPMQFLNKGDLPKGGNYLKCDKEIRKIEGGCHSKSIRYELVEENVLLYCIGLNVSDIMPSDKKVVTELSGLQNLLQLIEGELSDIDKRLKNVYDSMEITSNPIVKKDLNHRASAFVIRQEKLIKEQKDTYDLINILLNTKKTTEEHLHNIQQLINKMKEVEGLERINLRLNLRNHLRRLIELIEVFSKEMIIVIHFRSGISRGIDLSTSEVIADAYPESKWYIRTKPGQINKLNYI